jgi:hypothetical protein
MQQHAKQDNATQQHDARQCYARGKATNMTTCEQTSKRRRLMTAHARNSETTTHRSHAMPQPTPEMQQSTIIFLDSYLCADLFATMNLISVTTQAMMMVK